eukprot:310359-Pyramimonas_sp.AAC.1
MPLAALGQPSNLSMARVAFTLETDSEKRTITALERNTTMIKSAKGRGGQAMHLGTFSKWGHTRSSTDS